MVVLICNRMCSLCHFQPMSLLTFYTIRTFPRVMSHNNCNDFCASPNIGIIKIRVEFRSNYMVKNYSLHQCSTAMRMIIIDDYIVRLIKTVESLFFPPKTILYKPLEM